MDTIAFPYRSSSHLVLLHFIAEPGAWERHRLDVDYDQQISSSEAHRAGRRDHVRLWTGISRLFFQEQLPLRGMSCEETAFPSTSMNTATAGELSACRRVGITYLAAS
jgi:hypothetical protein